MSEASEQAYVEMADLPAFLRQVGETGDLPPGITVRPVNPVSDEAVIAELYNAAFRYEPLEKVTAQDVAGYARHPGLTHQGVFLAFDGCLAVGLVVGRVDVPAPGGEAHRGAVELLAIRPGYRRRGIGRELIYRVFHWLAEQQVRRVGATAENPAIVDILKTYGFQPAPPPGI
ncbi:MAG TPA: GNAT family N-acetyltransferase [Anaerolineae bacterium]|nr:GNAT family N-acetyltransferase [Anaerolineae bacterium]